MTMSKKAFADWQMMLKTSFVPLVKLKPDRSAEGFWGSGTLFDFRNRRFLCSARHNFLDGPVAMQIRWCQERFATLVTKPLSPNFFALKSGGFIDFVVADVSEIKDVPKMQELDENANGEILYERMRTIFPEKSLLKPKPTVRYGFAGTTVPEIGRHKNDKIDIAYGCVRVVTGLEYVGDENGFHLFKLPVEHPGHAFFRGCSGAPIIDHKGYIVAFVNGATEELLIRGFPAEVAKGILIGCTMS